MTINQAIEKVNKLKDNAFDDEIIKGFLEDCDRRVYREIIETHEDNKFDYDTRYPLKGDAQLLAEAGIKDMSVDTVSDIQKLLIKEYVNGFNDTKSAKET